MLADNKNSLNQPSDYLKNFSFSWKTNPNWLLLILFLLIVRVNAQEVWTQVQAPGGNVLSSQQLGKAYYILNTGSIQSTQKVDISGEEHQLMVLPNEKGQMETFSISKVGLLSKALSERFPNINTYEGRSRSRPNVRVRLSTHPNGINAWLKLVDGPDFFIQTQKGQKNLHFTYLKSKTDETLSLSCKTQDAVELKSKVKTLDSKSKLSNNIIKTFRIAIATTAEYTSFWGDNDDSNGTNVEDAFGAVVSSLNRISSVFEDEVKVRLELVSDERLFYEDAETDPFTGNFASELQSTLDEVREADLLIHILDISHPNFEDHYNVVNETLAEIDKSEKPTILVFNKIDAYTPEAFDETDLMIERSSEHYSLDEWKETWMAKTQGDAVFISAAKKTNMEHFRNRVYQKVREQHITRFPYNHFLYPEIEVEEE